MSGNYPHYAGVKLLKVKTYGEYIDTTKRGKNKKLRQAY